MVHSVQYNPIQYNTNKDLQGTDYNEIGHRRHTNTCTNYEAMYRIIKKIK